MKRPDAAARGRALRPHHHPRRQRRDPIANVAGAALAAHLALGLVPAACALARWSPTTFLISAPCFFPTFTV